MSLEKYDVKAQSIPRAWGNRCGGVFWTDSPAALGFSVLCPEAREPTDSGVPRYCLFKTLSPLKSVENQADVEDMPVGSIKQNKMNTEGNP